jgi:hypothetical protein
MLTESQLKVLLGQILTCEERDEETDWVKVANLSAACLDGLPASLPPIVQAYLTEADKRKADPMLGFAQRAQLLRYLRS